MSSPDQRTYGSPSHRARRTALREALTDQSVTDVAWFWQPGAGAVSGDRLRAECERNYRNLLDLVSAVSGSGSRRPPRLWLVTERAQWLPADRPDGAEQLAAATLWGFGNVLLNEYPQLRATLVDLPKGSRTEGAEALLAEWQAQEADEFQVAHRTGRRYVRRLLPGDRTPVRPGPYELHARDADDPARIITVPAGDTAPEGSDIRVRTGTAAASLTARDVPPAADPAASGDGTQALSASAFAGTVVAAGPHATHTVGEKVTVGRPGVLGSTLTVPSALATPWPDGLGAAEAACAALPAPDGSAPRSPHTGEVDTYRVDEADEALRAAAAGPGPVAIALDPPGPPQDGPGDETAFTIRPDRTYVVTGGLGGLGLVTARKLVDLGARHLALVSRSGRAADEAAPVLQALSAHAEVSLLRADVGNADEVRRLTAELHALPHPVGGIVHAAGAIGKALIAELTWEAIEEQLAAKAYGGWLVHEASLSFDKLDFFTFYSSIAAVVGGATQSHWCTPRRAPSSTAWPTGGPGRGCPPSP
ncbi:SDR family NAD(P)-dependent oxidoreductase [Streptomyces hypolithicus]